MNTNATAINAASLNVAAINAALMPESDARILRLVFFTCVIGLLGSAYFSTIEFVVDQVLESANTPQGTAHVQINMHDTKKPAEKVAAKPTDTHTKRPGHGTHSGGKTTAKGVPHSITGLGVLAFLTAKTHNMNQSAYQMVDMKMHHDLEKVLQSNIRISTVGHTRIGGPRQGKADGTFNGIVGGDGDGDGLDAVLASTLTKGSTIAVTQKGKRIEPKTSEISMQDGNGGRSVAEIMRVVRDRTPGLRYIYNRYLKLHPGMAGKVTLRFTILAGGSIADCQVFSSSTQESAFDNDVREAVSTWSFKVIKAGNTTVTIPFTFSE